MTNEERYSDCRYNPPFGHGEIVMPDTGTTFELPIDNSSAGEFVRAMNETAAVAFQAGRESVLDAEPEHSLPQSCENGVPCKHRRHESDKDESAPSPDSSLPVTRASITYGMLRLASRLRSGSTNRWGADETSHSSRLHMCGDINATIDNAVDAALREAAEVARGLVVFDGVSSDWTKNEIITAIDELRKSKQEESE